MHLFLLYFFSFGLAYSFSISLNRFCTLKQKLKQCYNRNEGSISIDDYESLKFYSNVRISIRIFKYICI